LLVDIKNVSRECDICQQSKIVTNPRTAPLVPLPVPRRPFSFVSMDHKVLSRTTDQGNNLILAFVDHFSKFVKFVAVPDKSAYTTAKVFVAEIIATYGRVDYLLSGKGSGYMSTFFATVNKILGIKHKTSAALAKRTNGVIERQIKALNQGLKIYSDPEADDRHVENILPLIELSVRASANSDTKLSPFFILHGYEMPLPIKSDVIVPDTFHSRQAQQYANWLKDAIKALHETVRISRLEAKHK